MPLALVFSLYSALSSGTCLAIDAYSTEELKISCLPMMYAGSWPGTM